MTTHSGGICSLQNLLGQILIESILGASKYELKMRTPLRNGGTLPKNFIRNLNYET